MSILREVGTGRQVELPPRALVGRSKQADLCLDWQWVSGEHAVIWWDGRTWRIRDLSSRNGTTVDGRPIDGRDGVDLSRGCVVAIGQAETAWVLDDDGPPTPMAIANDGSVRLAVDDVIGLPEESDPRVVVRRDAERWVLSGGEGDVTVTDRHPLVLDGRSWTLRLPEGATPTGEVMGRVCRLDELRLELDVSRDEETIDARLFNGRSRIGLDPRSHHYVLVLLARQRLADRAAGRSEADEGWIDAEVLCEMLKQRRDVLNVYVYRIRQQFIRAGVIDGAEVIARRPHAHQLRLAVADLAVGAL